MCEVLPTIDEMSPSPDVGEGEGNKTGTADDEHAGGERQAHGEAERGTGGGEGGREEGWPTWKGRTRSS